MKKFLKFFFDLIFNFICFVGEIRREFVLSSTYQKQNLDAEMNTENLIKIRFFYKKGMLFLLKIYKQIKSNQEQG